MLAYTRYVLDAGMRGVFTAPIVMIACRSCKRSSSMPDLGTFGNPPYQLRPQATSTALGRGLQGNLGPAQHSVHSAAPAIPTSVMRILCPAGHSLDRQHHQGAAPKHNNDSKYVPGSYPAGVSCRHQCHEAENESSMAQRPRIPFGDIEFHDALLLPHRLQLHAGQHSAVHAIPSLWRAPENAAFRPIKLLRQESPLWGVAASSLGDLPDTSQLS